MNWQKFSNSSIALLGAGKENLSIIRHLSRYTKDITLLDRRELDHKIRVKLGKYFPHLKIKTGDNYLDHLHYDFLFRSPGLPVREVRTRMTYSKSKLTSALNLFLEISPTDRIIGVTGTKGKGTTSLMIFNICKQVTHNCFLAGNIGQSIFEEWEKLNNESIVVIEMSSFQLEDLNRSPQIAVLLPLEKDHLEPLSDISPNFHTSYKAYVKAKANITKYQNSKDILIFLADNPDVCKIASASKARKLAVAFNQKADYKINENGQLSGKLNNYNLYGLGLRGHHMFMDGAMAIATCEALLLDKANIEEGLKKFKSLPHRFEKFYCSNGIEFIDDSYATTPSSTIYAFEAIDKPIHWIGGGSRKGADFKHLAKVVASSKLAGAYLIGQEAKRLKSLLEIAGVEKTKINTLNSLEEAVKICLMGVKKGEVVLLSPACASKDMFSDAAERGDKFKKLIYESGV